MGWLILGWWVYQRKKQRNELSTDSIGSMVHGNQLEYTESGYSNANQWANYLRYIQFVKSMEMKIFMYQVLKSAKLILVRYAWRTPLASGRIPCCGVSHFIVCLDPRLSGDLPKWLSFVASCVEHQCDFITGDGNLFAQRSFKSDDHSDFRTCIMIDILEHFLQQINLHRSPINRITYNVVSSTTAADYNRSLSINGCPSLLWVNSQW